jgi:hypothetical protein
VLILEAPSLIDVRLIAGVRASDRGEDFVGGHRLDAGASRQSTGDEGILPVAPWTSRRTMKTASRLSRRKKIGRPSPQGPMIKQRSPNWSRWRARLRFAPSPTAAKPLPWPNRVARSASRASPHSEWLIVAMALKALGARSGRRQGDCATSVTVPAS